MSFEQLLGELIGEVKGLRGDVTRLYQQHDGFVQSNNERHTMAEGRLFSEVNKLNVRVSKLEESKLAVLVSTKTAVTVALIGFGLILHGLKDAIMGALEWLRGL